MHQFVHVIIGNEAPDGAIHFPKGVHGYTYLNHIEDVKVGDIVVVLLPTLVTYRKMAKKPLTTRQGAKLRFAKVVAAHSNPEQGKAATKWIVDRVDWEKFDALRQLVPPESFDER